MPCYNGDDNYDRGYSAASAEVRDLKKTIEKFEAVLCGIMKLDPKIVDRIDWKEVGITKKQHLAWWKDHQNRDREQNLLADWVIARQKTFERELAANAKKVAKKKAVAKKKVAKKVKK